MMRSALHRPVRFRHWIGLACALAACSTTKNTPRAQSCDIVATAPACVATRARQMCAGPRHPDERMSVTRYTYRAKDVYYIPPHCCDVPGQLLDAECRTICRPDGGLTGRGDGQCPDFVAARSGGELIWKE